MSVNLLCKGIARGAEALSSAGTAKQKTSASKIQALFRGHRARSGLKPGALQQTSVSKIQALILVFSTSNIRSLIGNDVLTAASKLMLVSKGLYSRFQQDMNWTLQAALNMPQFKSVLTEADQQKSSMEQLGQLVAYAKKQMSSEQYQAIKQKYPINGPLFAKLADQIQANKDDATLALGYALRQSGLPFLARRLEEIRAWCNNPTNSAAIQGVTDLDLWLNFLKVVPDELSLFTGLQVLSLQYNQLESVDVSGLTQLQVLKLQNNRLTSIDVSGLTQLRDLNLSNNRLTSIDITDLLGLTQLQFLSLENNPLPTIQRLLFDRHFRCEVLIKVLTCVAVPLYLMIIATIHYHIN